MVKTVTFKELQKKYKKKYPNGHEGIKKEIDELFKREGEQIIAEYIRVIKYLEEHKKWKEKNDNINKKSNSN